MVICKHSAILLLLKTGNYGRIKRVRDSFHIKLAIFRSLRGKVIPTVQIFRGMKCGGGGLGVRALYMHSKRLVLVLLRSVNF